MYKGYIHFLLCISPHLIYILSQCNNNQINGTDLSDKDFKFFKFS